MKNFWTNLPRPFLCLAPMYDVTDEAFRLMFAKYGKPGVLFTEFVSADGLASEDGRPKLLRELQYSEVERPIVAQIFGAQPETIEISAKLIKDLGFDGLDINMGCPDRTIEKQGAGSALIKNPKLAQEIILAAKRGFDNGPVSVKTRIGYNKFDPDWLKAIREAKPEAVTIHLRTRKELSEVEAHWELWPQVAEIFKGSGIVLIANGDIKDVEEGKELAEKYDNLDGLMIGRGAFGKPWLFAEDSGSTTWLREVGLPSSQKDNQTEIFSDNRSESSSEPEVSLRLEEKLKIMVEHAKLFQKLFIDGTDHKKNFAVMRKHFKAYVSGFRGATALRTKLMETQNADEVEAIISAFGQ